MTNQDMKLMSQSNSWMRIGKLAKHKEVVFNNLFQHFNVENLREAYHAIDGSKAVGHDRITKDQYGLSIEANLSGLVDRLHIGTYRPQVKRGVEIPKANGKTRLIAVGAFEDKLVEWVLAQILTQLYEPLFIETSYGFRPKRSCADAIVQCHNVLCQRKSAEWILEADIKGCFDNISHQWILQHIPLNKKVLTQWLKAGYMEKKH